MDVKSIFRLIAVSLCGGLLTIGAISAVAQTFPDKPIRLVVPYPPGGGIDIMARILADSLSKRLGWVVVVDNRGGAGGIIGTEHVARAAPDGYTLTFGTNATHGIFVSLHPKLPYDPVKDFAPVTNIVQAVNILVVSPTIPAKSVQELISVAKSQPGKLNYASAGVGSQGHLGMELFNSMSGVKIEHVPYQGAPAALTDVITGRVQMMMPNIPSALPFLKSGKLKALAVATAKRTPLFPDLPTVDESGLPGYVNDSWWALFAPAGTSAAIIATLNSEFRKTLEMPDVRNRLLEQGLEPNGTTPAELAAIVESGISKWEKVVKESGIRVD
jgi:tripartite-type tricarboxylate transporter receptor subunit TctC